MSESRTDESQLSDFSRALNSMMDNLENVAVTFQETLLIVLEKIEKLESLEKHRSGGTAPNERGPNSKENKQLTNDTITSAKTPHRESNEEHTETTTKTETKSRLYQNEIICVIAIALAILGIIIAKLYFMLF